MGRLQTNVSRLRREVGNECWGLGPLPTLDPLDLVRIEVGGPKANGNEKEGPRALPSFLSFAAASPPCRA